MIGNLKNEIYTNLLPRPFLSLFGRSAWIFLDMSANKHRAGVVIVSFSSVNWNQAAHSTPPPPTVVLFERFGLSTAFFSEYARSGAHRLSEENVEAEWKGTGVAFEGWRWRGWRRAYGEGGDNVSRGPGSEEDGASTPKIRCAVILAWSWYAWSCSWTCRHQCNRANRAHLLHKLG
jgi:hypothetical protein